MGGEDDDNLVKLGIRDDDGTVETPWAVRLGGDLYRLDNIPFFAYRLSIDDVVEALPESDGFLMFARVVRKSGNRTVRAILAEPADVEPGPSFLAEMKRLGCTIERATQKFICVNVPPPVLLESVTDSLIELGVQWEYADPKYEDLFPEDDVN
jgi:hypothetical protein